MCGRVNHTSAFDIQSRYTSSTSEAGRRHHPFHISSIAVNNTSKSLGECAGKLTYCCDKLLRATSVTC